VNNAGMNTARTMKTAFVSAVPIALAFSGLLGGQRDGDWRAYGRDEASRGVSAWQRGSERRIFVATIDARLMALDASTGQPIRGFGELGTVDLRKGLRIAPVGFADYEVSPPAVIGDTIVVGSAVQDGATTTEPSGEVRAFDAITGRLKWSWDPIPQDPSAVEADTPIRVAGSSGRQRPEKRSRQVRRLWRSASHGDFRTNTGRNMGST
jgi:hypothetical protein